MIRIREREYGVREVTGYYRNKVQPSELITI
jgi:hypothetical protein